MNVQYSEPSERIRGLPRQASCKESSHCSLAFYALIQESLRSSLLGLYFRADGVVEADMNETNYSPVEDYLGL